MHSLMVLGLELSGIFEVSQASKLGNLTWPQREYTVVVETN